MPPKKVLFLCIGNACRSQMAEAIARHLAADVIKPTSAGLFPFGVIPSSTTAVLAEKNMNCDGQTSKPLLDADLRAADLIVNMTGRQPDRIFDDETLPVEDWDVGDPFGSDLGVYRDLRDEVERRVIELAERLRASAPARSGDR